VDPNIHSEVVDLLPMALQTEEELHKSESIRQEHIAALKRDSDSEKILIEQQKTAEFKKHDEVSSKNQSSILNSDKVQ
jgi:hypothetical protein